MTRIVVDARGKKAGRGIPLDAQGFAGVVQRKTGDGRGQAGTHRNHTKPGLYAHAHDEHAGKDAGGKHGAGLPAGGWRRSPRCSSSACAAAGTLPAASKSASCMPIVPLRPAVPTTSLRSSTPPRSATCGTGQGGKPACFNFKTQVSELGNRSRVGTAVVGWDFGLGF